MFCAPRPRCGACSGGPEHAPHHGPPEPIRFAARIPTNADRSEHGPPDPIQIGSPQHHIAFPNPDAATAIWRAAFFTIPSLTTKY
ncbi:hypothetical protein FTUN_1976 [Frigoriglobus tundricola]|uniref:Uncharacterized protein n=1 Tax=Frigoriglobus tundricola TaxID=2774151 RepID=A0A6M5YM92_9BACT|nr:hypothetical protein FTUN_1976 [Frigoriglobus tundricola]